MVNINTMSHHGGLYLYPFMSYTPKYAGYINFLGASMALFCIWVFPVTLEVPMLL